MKRFGSTIAVIMLAAWCASLVGCATLKEKLNPVRVYALTEFAAYNTAMQLAKNNPAAVESIAKARDGFCQLSGSGVWDIRRASEIALENGLYAFVSEEGDILIQGGLLLVDLFGPTIDLSQSDHAQAFVTASCNGLSKAVETATSVKPKVALAGTGSGADDPVWKALSERAKATRPARK